MADVACPSTETTIGAVFALSSLIRYVALSRNGDVAMCQRSGLTNASAGESDLYEELLVNPTLLTLAKARGDIDCGGLRFLIVGYGHFQQLVIALPDGHISVCFDTEADPLCFVDEVRNICVNAVAGSSSARTLGPLPSNI
jgi:hypothetical protein